MSFCNIAITSAAIPTQNYDALGLAVVAGQNTPLARLVQEVYVDHNPVNQSGQYKVDTTAMVNYTNSPDPILGYSEYNQVEDETAETVAEFLRGHIAGFKTQVAPMVDAFAERLCARINLLEGNPDNGAQVIRQGTPLPFQEPSLVESFNRAKDVVVVDQPLEMKLAKVSMAEIQSFMSTGNSSVDAAVSEHFNTLDGDWLTSAWERIFTSGDIPTPRPAGLNGYINGRGEGVCYALFVFLVARKLMDSPPEGTDMALHKYTTLMGNYRDQAAQRLCREMELAGREQSSGQLVHSIEKSGTGETTICVDQNVYKEFLKAGGTNEMLLANALLKNPFKGVNDLMQNKETLARQWATHYASNKSYFEQKRLTAVRNAMVSEFDHMVRGMSDDDFPMEQRGVSRNLMIDFTRGIKMADTDCLKTLALKAICRSRFHATHAEMFLLSMERAMRDCGDESMTPEQACHIAGTEYVARWLASQMKVVGAKSTSVF